MENGNLLNWKLEKDGNFEYNEFDVCLNPIKTEPLDGVEISIYTALYKGRWTFGLNAFGNINDCGYGFGAFTENAIHTTQDDAINAGIDYILNSKPEQLFDEQTIKRLKAERAKRQNKQLTLF